MFRQAAVCLRDGCKVTTEVMLGTLQQAVLVLQGLPSAMGLANGKSNLFALLYRVVDLIQKNPHRLHLMPRMLALSLKCRHGNGCTAYTSYPCCSVNKAHPDGCKTGSITP